jgi:hypothetical protein
MKQCVVLSLITLSLLGCATGASTKADANKQAGLVCEKETSLGSHIVKKHCTTTAEREKQRQQAADSMAAPTSNTRSN